MSNGSSPVKNSVDVEGDENSSERKESLGKRLSEVQSLLKQKKDVVDKLENDKDLLEKENILKETEIKVRFVVIEMGFPRRMLHDTTKDLSIVCKIDD